MSENTRPEATIRKPNGALRIPVSVPLLRVRHVREGTGGSRVEVYQTVEPRPGLDGYNKLCRCGASKDMPFCDHAHLEIGWDGTQTAPSSPAEEGLDPAAAAEVLIIDNGPYKVTGGLAVTGSDGQQWGARQTQVLCRCGESSNKPFCDGVHRRNGFTECGTEATL